jgi:hypothetical protein
MSLLRVRHIGPFLHPDLGAAVHAVMHGLNSPPSSTFSSLASSAPVGDCASTRASMAAAAAMTRGRLNRGPVWPIGVLGPSSRGWFR